MTLKLVFILIPALLVLKVRSSNYEIIAEKIESAFGDDDKLLKIGTLRVKKYNRTAYVVDGTYEILYPVDDSFTISVQVLNFQGGQYRKMFESGGDKLCTNGYNDTFRPYFDDFQGASTPPVEWKACPYPPGEYRISNYMLEDHANLLPDYIPGGEKWKIQCTYAKDGVEYGGYNVYGILRNERSLLNG